MRRPALFKQNDVTKALRAARDAGLPVSRVEIEPTGKIVIRVSEDDDPRDVKRNISCIRDEGPPLTDWN